jgi:CRISPR system Cascade subunit CasA
MDNAVKKAFNLLDEQWILVSDGKGAATAVSLLDAFRNAHAYKRLANEMPTVDAAILRLLLAILYEVFAYAGADGNEAALTTENAIDRWKGIWNKGQFPYAPIEEYLNDYRENFWLIHPETPFYQVGDAEIAYNRDNAIPDKKPLVYLIGDLVEGEGSPRLFTHRQNKSVCTKAESARWLLHFNSFDLSPSGRPSSGRPTNIKGYGRPFPAGLGIVYLSGVNLFETLMYNFVLLNNENEAYDFRQTGAYWGTEPDSPIDFTRIDGLLPANPAELLSARYRYCRLICDGDDVKGIHRYAGVKFGTTNISSENMTLWKKEKQSGDIVPYAHETGKQFWRNFEAICGKESDDDCKTPGVIRWIGALEIDQSTLGCNIVQTVCDSNGWLIDMFSDSIDINTKLLSPLNEMWQVRIIRELKRTEKAVGVFCNLAVDLALAKGLDEGKRGRNLIPIRNAAKEQAYLSFDMPFRNWLARIDASGDPDAVMETWKEQAKQIIRGLANDMLNDVSDAAFIGHKDKTAAEAEIRFNINLARALKMS